VGQTPNHNVSVNTSLASAVSRGNSVGMWTYSGWFQGSMDEARFWNVARTAQQISGNKNKEIPSAEGLLARHGLNEGSGTVAHDSSGSVPAFDGALMSHNDDLGGGNPATWVTGSPFQPGSVKSANRALALNVLGTLYMPPDYGYYISGYVDLGTNPAFGLSTFSIEASTGLGAATCT
jgi:hypothetical protein